MTWSNTINKAFAKSKASSLNIPIWVTLMLPFWNREQKSIRQSETISFLLILQELGGFRELGLLACDFFFFFFKLRVTHSHHLSQIKQKSTIKKTAALNYSGSWDVINPRERNCQRRIRKSSSDTNAKTSTRKSIVLHRIMFVHTSLWPSIRLLTVKIERLGFQRTF